MLHKVKVHWFDSVANPSAKKSTINPKVTEGLLMVKNTDHILVGKPVTKKYHPVTKKYVPAKENNNATFLYIPASAVVSVLLLV